MDSGLTCFVLISQYHQIAVQPKQILRQYGDDFGKLDEVQLLRAANDTGFKSKLKLLSPDLKGLNNKHLPIIARRRDGQHLVVARVGGDTPQGKRFLIHDPSEAIKQANLTEQELKERISGEVIFLKKKDAPKFLTRSFDINWFIPAFSKYRKLFLDVFVASLFIQIFALATPLFFQIVMDKVLVHQTLSTLDILAIGFFTIIAFDTGVDQPKIKK